MDQSDVTSSWRHDLSICEKDGYREFFMQFGSMRADIFLTPEVFERKPDVAEEALKALKSIALTNVIEEISEAMYCIRVLGQSLSAELFDANPVLAQEALNIFTRAFRSNSYSVRNATIKETRDLIFASVNEGDHRLNTHILTSLLVGVYHSRTHNAPYVVNTANAVIEDLSERFPKVDGTSYSGFEIDSLTQAMLTTSVENLETKHLSEIPEILEEDL
jgi:hypothetical protein